MKIFLILFSDGLRVTWLKAISNGTFGKVFSTFQESIFMKNLFKYFYFSALLITLTFTSAALADVKIKARQTMGGQTYENTTYIKGKRQRTERDMGPIKMVDLMQCDLKRSVQMNPAAKTYIINLFNQAVEDTNQMTQTTSAAKKDGVVRAGGTVTMTVTYRDTGETRKMFGYAARRIITTIETVSSPDSCAPNSSKMEIDGWYIDAAFVLDCQNDVYKGGYSSYQKQGCQDKYVTKTVGSAKRGYPVYEKMTMFDQSGKETMTSVTEVIELSQATLDQALFEVPSDYREVSDMSQMYASTSMTSNVSSVSGTTSTSGATQTTSSGTISAIQNQSQTGGNDTEIGPKQPGTVRIGLANVKVGAVGDGITSADLAAAVQNTLGEFLKGTNIELVPLNAKLSSAIESEARQKDCDYVLYANVSHKKGGGGGGFGGLLGSAVSQGVGRVGIGQTGSRVGNVIGQVATQTIVTAGQMSSNVKAKDEITLEVKMNQPGSGSAVLTKQAKAKAKSDGEDIISAVVEQIAQAVFNAVSK
jgi:hypothetical protein